VTGCKSSYKTQKKDYENDEDKIESGLTFYDVTHRRSAGYFVAFITCKDKHSHDKYY
jgi:hypothetical protein